MAANPNKKIALALQGSFGHIQYALGIMAALQERQNQRGDPPFIAASGCVEMLLPLWLYFAEPNGNNIQDYFHDQQPAINLLWGPSDDSLTNYTTSTIATLCSLYTDPFNERTLEKLATMPFVPPAGLMRFNRQYFEGEAGQELATYMNKVKVPVFTNALDARSFREVYLYSGPLGAQTHTQILGNKGRAGKRGLEKLTLERFVASGARPPLFAPIKVGTSRGDQYWMEGAMRCDPPLNPLIDVGAEEILLIRFFAKRKATGQVDNQMELFDHYLDAIFSAPLEKELETIQAINGLIQQCNTAKSQVDIFDPSILDPSNNVPDFIDFLDNELDYLSHFRVYNQLQWQDMFNKGKKVGHAIFNYYKI